MSENKIVRVLRVLEYIGTDEEVTKNLSRTSVPLNGEFGYRGLKIKSAMVGNFPESVDSSELYVDAERTSAPAKLVEVTWDDSFCFEDMQEGFERNFEDNYSLAEWARNNVPEILGELGKCYQLLGKMISEKDK